MDALLFPWLSIPTWLYSDKEALQALAPPLGAEAFKALRPAILLVLTMLRRAAPLHACNDYGIFRTGFGQKLKPAYRIEVQREGTDDFEPVIFRTSFYQATGGVHGDSDSAGVLHPVADSLPPFFAPHQPRLDHAVFYNGLGASIGEAAAFEQYHLEPMLDPYVLLRYVGAALLNQSDHPDSTISRLFARVPPGRLTAVRISPIICRFDAISPRHRLKLWEDASLGERGTERGLPLMRLGSPWKSQCDSRPEADELNQRPVIQFEDTDLTGSNLLVAHRTRERHLHDGLRRERKLELPSTQILAAGASVLLGISWILTRPAALRKQQQEAAYSKKLE